MPIDPWDDTGSLLQRASEAQDTGQLPAAYEMFARASELSPNAAQAWRGRAATTPLVDDSLVSWAYAAALTPNDQTLLRELDQRLRIRLAEAKPNEAASLIAVGQKLAEAGFTNEAHLILHRATELDDNIAEGFVWSAATTDDLNKAAISLKRALVLNPGDPLARSGFSSVMLEIESAGAAAPPSVRLPAQEPQSVPLAESPQELIRTGEQALVSGDKTLAYQAFVRATELSPREEAAWLGRARASADTDETLVCLEQALAINPDNMQAREARTFYRVRKLREGVKRRQEPIEEAPRFTPTFAGGGGFSELPTPEVRQRRILLLVIMIVVLLFLIGALVVRFLVF